MNLGSMNILGALPSTNQQVPGQSMVQSTKESGFKKTIDFAMKDQTMTDKAQKLKNKDKQSTRQEHSEVKKSNEKNTERPNNKKTTKDQQVHEKKPVEDLEENVTDEVSETNSECTQMLQKQMEPLLAMLMDVLNISEEQLVQKLEELGLEITDLLSEENFGALVGELVGSDDLVLSIDQSTAKEIAKIWSQLEKLQQSQVGVEIDKKLIDVAPINLIQKNDEPKGQEIKLESIEVIQDENSTEPLNQNLNQEGSHQQEETLSGQASMPKVEDLIGFRAPVQSFQVLQEVKQFTQTEQVTRMNNDMTGKMVTDQIIKKLEISQLIRHNEIQMELTPKELGKVAMKLVEQNGVITAQIKVESDRTKELIVQNLESLKENLEKQGLTVGSFQVDVNADENRYQMDQQKQKSSKRIQEIISKHLGEGQEEENDSNPVNESLEGENQVDYMA